MILKNCYVKGNIEVPSSKSVAHRALIASAFSEKPIKIKKIDFSKDIYATIDALRQLDIEVKKKYEWGAKSQSNGMEYEVLDLAKEGFTAREISEKLSIKLNRVYYLLRKNKDNVKFDNYKRKHNHSEVKSLKEKGLSANEISEKLDMPLRTVYYILNKK